jgi:hypothetical protein
VLAGPSPVKVGFAVNLAAIVVAAVRLRGVAMPRAFAGLARAAPRAALAPGAGARWRRCRGARRLARDPHERALRERGAVRGDERRRKHGRGPCREPRGDLGRGPERAAEQRQVRQGHGPAKRVRSRRGRVRRWRSSTGAQARGRRGRGVAEPAPRSFEPRAVPFAPQAHQRGALAFLAPPPPLGNAPVPLALIVEFRGALHVVLARLAPLALKHGPLPLGLAQHRFAPHTSMGGFAASQSPN